VIGALLAVAALSVAAETEAVSTSRLSLDERIAAQEAIERVYHAHQLGETRPFEVAVPRALLEKKVLGYLTAAARWPIAAQELRSEVERLRRRTRLPDRLEELFDVLGHDPLRIEECLARPILLARIEATGSLEPAEEDQPAPRVAALEACVPDVWSPTSATAAPSPRFHHTAVWTGSVMLVWGGKFEDFAIPLGDGYRYDPTLDSWERLSSVGAPEGRDSHTAMWTGSQMIVWGGFGASGALASGGRYDPIADAWSPTSTQNAPVPRGRGAAVWTGSEMIVWGGFNGSIALCVERSRNDGGRYDPATDTWTPTALPPAPSDSGREFHTAVWTGSEMIIFGGYFPIDFGHGFCGNTAVSDGLAYDPVSDAWRSINSFGQALSGAGRVAVWTGSEMIVWGDGRGGGRYDPASDSWRSMSPVGAPPTGQGAAAAWTDSDMVVWGSPNAGARYDPLADSWSPTTATGAPSARQDPTGVWDGAGFVVWGGNNLGRGLGDGARYSPGNPDNDGDGICLDADNCPGAANASQANQDADGPGDTCDNCPTIPNPDQQETDRDGAGDACDTCPFDFDNDADADGVCGDIDNCSSYNAAQRDADGDGRGDVCDNCPTVFQIGFTDGDADGLGNECDCQPSDGGDRSPAAVDTVQVLRIGSTARLSWAPVSGADAYSVSRGVVGLLGPGEYGSCLVNDAGGTTFDDPAIPAAGQGYFYLVQAQNFECGLGSLGTDSEEVPRANTDPAACVGTTFTDLYASGEAAVFGTVSGSYTNTLVADDVRQAITEVLSTSGPPESRYSRLEHRWTFVIPAGSRAELHVEAFENLSAAFPETFRFESSPNGNQFTPVSLPPLPSTTDGVADLVGSLPPLSGNVTIRVVDVDHTPGEQFLSTVSVDVIWIRVVP